MRAKPLAWGMAVLVVSLMGLGAARPAHATVDYRSLVLADGPVSYWRLGEVSGSVAGNEVGGGPAGSYTGGVGLGQAGALPGDANASVGLDGSSGYVSAALASSLNLGDGPLTLEAWVRRSAAGRVDTIIHKGTNAYQLRFNTDNRLALWKANVAQVAQSSTTVTDSGWHYVVATKSGASVRLYVDAVDVTGTVTNQALTDATSSNLRIGVASGSGYFSGGVDEVAVYSSVLSGAQVQAHYDARLGSIVDNTPPAIALTLPTPDLASADPRPTIAGTAGLAPGDQSNVTIKIFNGASTTGTPLQTFVASRELNGSFTIDTPAVLASGQYTVSASQQDDAGNIGVSAPITFGVNGTPNPIVLENDQPGTDAWRLRRSGYQVATDVGAQIKGYASATSVPVGGSLKMFVNTAPAQSFSIDVYRMGWYGGLGGRLMQHIDNIAGVQQPACPVDSVTGMIACNWSPSYTLSVPSTWTTGVYLALLTNASNYQNYVMFVVRDDTRKPDLLYQTAVTTYQAYNNYPNDGITGKSTYEAGKAPSFGANTIAGTPRAVKVSFDRPYAGNGDGEFLKWEQYQVQWMERMGYDVGYLTDVDTHAAPARLLDAKGFVASGHDEYWSKAMYDGVEAVRGAGVGVAIFGGNSTYFQVRLEPSATGEPNRIMACYKNASIDPVQGPTVTVRWRDGVLNRAEQRLLGVQYTPSFDESDPYFAYVVKNSQNWIYSGTGLHDGDSVAGVVGYEVDRVSAGVPTPDAVPNTYVTVSQSPFISSLDGLSTANSTVYQDSSGAWVFGAGTIGWSWGLGKPGVVDARLERTTANILSAFINSPGAYLPAAPTGVAVVADTPNHLNVTWTDASTNESGFAIDVSTTPDFAVVQRGTAARNTTNYAFNGASPGTAYYVRVRAVNALGASPWGGPATATTPSAVTYRDVVLGDSPIAFWRLGESSGTAASSKTGVGPGTYNGGFTLGGSGAIVADANTSLALNGSTGYVSVPNTPAFNFGDTFTFETWFKRGTIGSDQRLLSKGDSGPVVQINSANRIRFAKSGGGDIAYSTVNLTDTAKWHHLVVTKNGSTVKMYLDGADVTGSVSNLAITNTTSPLNFGRDVFGGQYFRGSLDEVAIYNYALSPARVLAHYSAGGGSH